MHACIIIAYNLYNLSQLKSERSLCRIGTIYMNTFAEQATIYKYNETWNLHESPSVSAINSDIWNSL